MARRFGADALVPCPRLVRRGGALLETVLVLPVLLLLTFGTVEVGHFLFVRHCLAGAAREGSREAIVPTATDVSVRAKVASMMNAAGLAGRYTCTVEPEGTAVEYMSAGTQVTVTVECRWGTVGIRPLGLLGQELMVNGMATMRKEGD